MKVIVDSNILISALISPQGKELELLMNPWTKGIFYSCDFLRKEVLRNKEKIIRSSRLPESDLLNLIVKVSGRINFINEEQIPGVIWAKALAQTKDIDESDTPFLALALYLRGILWTGDKKLIRKLTAKGFKEIKNTAQTKKVGFQDVTINPMNARNALDGIYAMNSTDAIDPTGPMNPMDYDHALCNKNRHANTRTYGFNFFRLFYSAGYRRCPIGARFSRANLFSQVSTR